MTQRVLWHWRGLPIHAYPALLYGGLVAGTIAGTRAAAMAGLDPRRAYAATLLLLVPALAGARLLFVLTNWSVYRREPALIWRRADGGFALYGGLLLAWPASVPLLRALGLDFWAFWDAATVTMLVGMVFARVGCLLNGCCAGRPTAGIIGLMLSNHRGALRRRIPTQMLEGGLALALLASVVAAWPRRPFDGSVFLCVVVGYGAARALLEGTREDVDRIAGWSLHRVISLGLLALAGAGMLVLARR